MQLNLMLSIISNQDFKMTMSQENAQRVFWFIETVG